MKNCAPARPWVGLIVALLRRSGWAIAGRPSPYLRARRVLYFAVSGSAIPLLQDRRTSAMNCG
ncbi:hypothetical protein CR492_01520 [Methylocella silvestris]|uniref:Uncharacterized protein n=1 Tax=Methylocella silvestris TaxID=199596 RepID=A0A2J7TLH6_METSI|nr:hypothetical protein CR492_01520 [Methylocella silvestris]